MKNLDPNLMTNLRGTRDNGVSPVLYFWIVPKDRDTDAIEPIGFWSGDEDITVTVELPQGGFASRVYLGGVGLQSDAVEYTAELLDNPVTVSVSQIAPAVQQTIRGWDPRMAYCEIHKTSRVGGAFASVPQIEWVGVVDDVVVDTPEAGGKGRMGLEIRSEIMSQLTAINPARSSDTHQKRRRENDEFSKYSGIIGSRQQRWYYKKEE